MLNRIQKTADDLKQMNDNLAARVAKSGREFGLSPLAPATHSAIKRTSDTLCSNASSSSVSVS